jgi:hypothetical protein
MKVLGIRSCKVAPAADVKAMAEMLGENGFGLTPTDLGALEGFSGAVFPVGDAPPGLGSWIEFWAAGENMPKMTMLQIVVDDADA